MRQSLFFLVATGCTLHLYTFSLNATGTWSLFMFGLLAFSATPYLVALFIGRFRFAAGGGLGFAAAALLGDLYMHYSVFIAPKGSTAALGLLFMPIWNLLLLGPFGGLVGWATTKVASKRRAKNAA
jgi:hypothetical protein